MGRPWAHVTAPTGHVIVPGHRCHVPAAFGVVCACVCACVCKFMLGVDHYACWKMILLCVCVCVFGWLLLCGVCVCGCVWACQMQNGPAWQLITIEVWAIRHPLLPQTHAWGLHSHGLHQGTAPSNVLAQACLRCIKGKGMTMTKLKKHTRA